MKLPFFWRRPQVPANLPAAGLSVRGPGRLDDAIAASQIGDDESRYLDLWVDVVMRLSPVQLLIGHQNVVIFGPKSAGRQAVMCRLVNATNAQFKSTRQAGVYVNLEEQSAASQIYTWPSVEEILRALVMSPIVWARSQLGLASDRALEKIEAGLRQQIAMPAARVSALEVRNHFLAWLNALCIERLSLYVDEVSALPPDMAPVLLRMLLDMFPRGGRVVLKLGSRKDTLRIGERTKAGIVGLQINHDVVVGMDLEEILTIYPPELTNEQATLSDPKQVFLAACLKQLVPAVAGQLQLDSRPQWGRLFDPPESWFELFRLNHYDIEMVGISVENLVRQASKFNLLLIERAVEQARNDGMRPPSRAQTAPRIAPRTAPQQESSHGS